MKKTLAATFLLALAACAPAPPAPEPLKTQDATAELKPVMEKIIASFSTLDVNNRAPFYAQDAGITFYGVAPFKASGWAEHAADFQKASADWKSMKLTIGADFQATRYGNIAWSTGTYEVEVEPKEGAVTKDTARATHVFEKRGNDWIVVHEHASYPLPGAPPPADKK